MKKFTSILCALVIALGAIAAPQLNVKDLAEKSVRAKMHIDDVCAKKVDLKQVKRLSATDFTVRTLPAASARRVKDDITFTLSVEDIASSKAKVTITPSDNDATYYWGYEMFSEMDGLSDEQLVTSIKEDIEDDIELYAYFGVTMTFADFLSKGKVEKDLSSLTPETKYVLFAIEMDAEGNAGTIAKKEFTTLASVIPEGGNFEMATVSETSYTSDIWVKMYDADENVFRFDLLLGEGESGIVSGKTYQLADMDASYSYATYDGNKITYTAASFTKTNGENGAYEIVASFVDGNENTWNLHYSYVKPEATRQAELTLSNLNVNIFDGGWQLYGLNEDNTIYVSISADSEEINGTYTEEDLDPTYSVIYTDVVLDEDGYIESGKKYAMVEANLAVAYDEETRAFTIAGTFVGQNGEDVPEFTLTLSGVAPEEEKAIELPEGAEVVEYSMSYTDYYGEEASKPINVAVVGNQVYFQGMSEALPKAWAVGTLEGTTVTFAAGQLMGEYGSYGEVIFPYGSDAVFTFDAEANTYSATGTIFGAAGSYYDGYYTNPVLTLVVEVAATPANPAITALKNGDYGYNIVFSVPTVDVEGNGLVSSKLSFQFFTDIEHDVQALVFTPTTHTRLAEEMTIIPFGFTEDWDFYDGQIYLNELYSADWNKLGIKSIYTGGGETNETEIQWFDIKEYAPATSIDNTNAAAKAVKRIENGQIVIEKNGVRYNVLGAEMK